MTNDDAAMHEHVERLRDEARRLAASGLYSTWQEVEAACVEYGMAAHDARSVFESSSFQGEIEALAESAHGVGGAATE